MIELNGTIKTDSAGRRVLPEGLVRIFLDPRAEGLSPSWVVRLMDWPGPKPETAEQWLALYLGMRSWAAPIPLSAVNLSYWLLGQIRQPLTAKIITQTRTMAGIIAGEGTG